MVLEVILKRPSRLSVSPETINLRVEKLVYGIHRDIILSQFSRRDSEDTTKTADVQGSLLNIEIDGILTSVSDMKELITATRSWWTWVEGSGTVSQLPSVKWRSRSYQYCEISNLSITDDSASDSHEFEYTLSLALDTRT